VSIEEKKANARRAIEEIYSKRNLEAVDDIYASDYVLHATATDPELHGLEDVKQFVNVSRDTFHDVNITVEDQVGEGDKIVTRWKARVNPKRGVAGIYLTDDQVTGTGIFIDRISGGKIRETWAEESLGGIEGLRIRIGN
jgi:predicted ester cyclase